MFRNVQNITLGIPDLQSVKIDNKRKGKHGIDKISLYAKPRLRVGQKKLTKWDKIWRWSKSVGVLIIVGMVLSSAIIFSTEDYHMSIEKLEERSSKIRRQIDLNQIHQSHQTNDDSKHGKVHGRKSTNVILLTYSLLGSGYLGDLLTLPPESAYLMEPSPLWLPETSKNKFSLKPREFLFGLFNCHRGILRKMATTRHFKMIRKLSPVKPNQTDNTVRLWRETDSTLAARCSKSKFRLVETSKLQVEHLISLVKDDHLKLKVIHFVRNPQELIRTGNKQNYHKFNEQLKEYCQNVSTNLILAQTLNRKHYLLVNYEDLNTDPMSVVRKTYNFLGLSSWYSIVRDYFRKHRNGRKWKFLESKFSSDPLNKNVKLDENCMKIVTYLEGTKTLKYK